MSSIVVVLTLTVSSIVVVLAVGRVGRYGFFQKRWGIEKNTSLSLGLKTEKHKQTRKLLTLTPYCFKEVNSTTVLQKYFRTCESPCSDK